MADKTYKKGTSLMDAGFERLLPVRRSPVGVRYVGLPDREFLPGRDKRGVVLSLTRTGALVDINFPGRLAFVYAPNAGLCVGDTVWTQLNNIKIEDGHYWIFTRLMGVIEGAGVHPPVRIHHETDYSGGISSDPYNGDIHLRTPNRRTSLRLLCESTRETVVNLRILQARKPSLQVAELSYPDRTIYCDAFFLRVADALLKSIKRGWISVSGGYSVESLLDESQLYVVHSRNNVKSGADYVSRGVLDVPEHLRAECLEKAAKGELRFRLAAAKPGEAEPDYSTWTKWDLIPFLADNRLFAIPINI